MTLQLFITKRVRRKAKKRQKKWKYNNLK